MFPIPTHHHTSRKAKTCSPSLACGFCFGNTAFCHAEVPDSIHLYSFNSQFGSEV